MRRPHCSATPKTTPVRETVEGFQVMAMPTPFPRIARSTDMMKKSICAVCYIFFPHKHLDEARSSSNKQPTHQSCLGGGGLYLPKPAQSPLRVLLITDVAPPIPWDSCVRPIDFALPLDLSFNQNKIRGLDVVSSSGSLGRSLGDENLGRTSFLSEYGFSYEQRFTCTPSTRNSPRTYDQPCSNMWLKRGRSLRDHWEMIWT